MVREFMGEVQDAFPDVNEWLDSDRIKKNECCSLELALFIPH
jgi:hypothetical protein